PATAAAVEDTCFAVPLALSDRITGQTDQLNKIDGCLSTLTGPENTLRLRRPSWYWQLMDYPGRTSFYRYPLELDAPSDLGIVTVNYSLQALYLDDGSDPALYGTVATAVAQVGADAGFASEFVIGKAAPGTYTVQAQAIDANGQVVATTEVYVYLGMAVNTVWGTSGRDTLTGTAGDDIFVGGTGADTLTGGAGRDIFVYRTLRDGIDQITDFVPGTDRIDLSEVLASIGYTAQNALKLGVVRLHNVSNSVQISIDTDGTAGPSAGIGLVRLRGLSVSALDPVR
ncbi:M10 family metallopeptidase C-terminal domain-containing protein, partial [Aquabacterium sp.]|uniref:M10 family metallopeptidase C-terminal domain-containing protein n=1 Tax=Aquabacterium sp. TaxID=1872578 RepID=UPI0035C6E9E8